jgi:hypothetical protein
MRVVCVGFMQRGAPLNAGGRRIRGDSERMRMFGAGRRREHGGDEGTAPLNAATMKGLQR